MYKQEMPGVESTGSSKTTKRRTKIPLSKTVIDKVRETQAIITRTMMSAQSYKQLDIIGPTELSTCITGLENVYSSLSGVRTGLEASKKRVDRDQVLNRLQDASAVLSSLFKTYGTHRLQDLVHICFGTAFESEHLLSSNLEQRYEIMCKHCHPIGYKVVDWKNSNKGKSSSDKSKEGCSLKKNRIVEDFMIVETASSLDGFDLARTSKAFHTKVKGIKFPIIDKTNKKTLIVCAIVDDIPLKCLDHALITARLNSFSTVVSDGSETIVPTLERYISTLTLKDVLVYNDLELRDKYTSSLTQAALIKQRTIAQATRDFLASDLYGQRSTLLHILVKADEHEFQYLAYLLYDLLSTDSSGGVDAQEQTLLFDSFPWAAKQYFQDAMRQTIKYTSSLANFDISRIPLEQQICLLKAPDSVKEKAMLKLREVKAKSEDSGSKARQYLEGLLRVPFGAYRHEPALELMGTCNRAFSAAMDNLTKMGCSVPGVLEKASYTSIEIFNGLSTIENSYPNHLSHSCISAILLHASQKKRADLTTIVRIVNSTLKQHSIKGLKIPVSGKSTGFMTDKLKATLESIADRPSIVWTIAKQVKVVRGEKCPLSIAASCAKESRESLSKVTEFMTGAREHLDKSVHGHEKAKRQLERIIGQWVNGEKTGYCFGFEGPPGVGKTSLAKHGVAQCLRDEHGDSRPFAFVAIGGSSNGSTLEGHNYTYVGSTWGRIVDVLMDKKCMNPIIFIDELDKVSRTEHGRELVGILTHLVDPTQNDAFQDKYFNGIDLDLSKALFVFSYNDVDAIDRVLLDRIHRIRFEHLTMQDKIAVSHKFLFPEIYEKMGLTDMIEISDEVLSYIIQSYTSEAGVRKLKELLFEIVGEINLQVLSGIGPKSIPVKVSKDDIRKNYLKGRRQVRTPLVKEGATVGVITGLWANHQGQGGILPVEARWRAAENPLDLKLTGMQGDVMKESMAVACTLACELVPHATKIAREREEGHRGIHVHVPEGATPKDGPSAGAAITTVLYSLISGIPIRNDLAVTGEICLQGKVTAIGGLDLKIMGGIRSGIKHFLFPKDNQDDFDEIQEKHKDTGLLEGIQFTSVGRIEDVLDAALVRT